MEFELTKRPAPRREGYNLVTMFAIVLEALRWPIFLSYGCLLRGMILCCGLLVSLRNRHDYWSETLIYCASGWSYATYSQFHRWSARIATLLAIVHGAGYSIIDGWQGRYETAWNYQFWYMGAIVSVIRAAVSFKRLTTYAERDIDVDTGHFLYLYGSKTLVRCLLSSAYRIRGGASRWTMVVGLSTTLYPRFSLLTFEQPSRNTQRCLQRLHLARRGHLVPRSINAHRKSCMAQLHAKRKGNQSHCIMG